MRKVHSGQRADITRLWLTAQASIVRLLESRGGSTALDFGDARPGVLLIVGVNGGGKTTTIGKLAHKFVGEGATVSCCGPGLQLPSAVDHMVASPTVDQAQACWADADAAPSSPRVLRTLAYSRCCWRRATPSGRRRRSSCRHGRSAPAPSSSAPSATTSAPTPCCTRRVLLSFWPLHLDVLAAVLYIAVRSLA